MRYNKKGVSLITVLLFMLIATIAGTATYKWLSSENSSSASRLLLNEARQSAMAGLEAARSWIANNANDAGAVVKTFYDNGKKPVKLNSLLKDLGSASQESDVYLMGVEKVNQSYRMKLLAEGRSRNGTTYSEISIIKVSGLYQVQLPAKPSSPIFEHAFFGTTSNPHNMNMTSSIINGDFFLGSATGAHINGDLVVTGNLSILKDSKVTGNVLVEGSALGCEGFDVGKNLRVKDKWYPSLRDSIFGDLYTDNGISFEAHPVYDSPSSSGPKCVTHPAESLYVQGNWTSLGDLDLVSRDKTVRFTVDGSAVIDGNINVYPRTETGTKSGTNQTSPTYEGTIEFHINKNVYINGGFVEGVFPNVSKSLNLSLGGDASQKVYIKDNNNRISDDNKDLSSAYSSLWNTSPYSYSSGVFYSPNMYDATKSQGIDVPKNTFCNNVQCIPSYDQPVYSTHADQKKDIYYQVNGSIASSSVDTVGWGASFYEVNLTDEKDGNCTGKHIQDPIQFNKAILNDKKIVHSATNGNPCPGLEQNTNFAWTNLNTCYENASEDELYQGKWLVVRVSNPHWWVSGSPKLKHNMIIVVDASPTEGEVYAPPTGDSHVLWYFTNGINNFQLSAGTSNDKFNYLIYSEGNISTVRLASVGGGVMTGSLFMSKCAVAGGTDDWNIEFNKNMLDGMATDNIFCEYDNTYNCSSLSGSTSGGSGSTTESETMDAYHIATSPQLNVVLESQYRNTELVVKKLGFVEPEPTVIVLPRFVYLAENAYGKLSDYYTAIGLNGAEQNLDQNRMTCPSEIPTGTSPLHADGATLTKGKYTCIYEYEHGGKKTEIPLYVVVNGTLGESPIISFDERNKEISANSSKMVSLNEATADHSVTVTITGPSPSHLPSGWSYSLEDGVSMVSDDGYSAVFRTTFVPSGNKKSLFNVTTEEHAAQGNVIFYLSDPCEDCIIGDPSSERVFMSGFVRVNRDSSLIEYCSNESNAEKFQDQYGEDCSEVAGRPTCEGVTDWTKNWSNWVTAVSGCSYEVRNNQWMCNASDPIHLQALMLNSDICKVYTPDSVLTELDLGSSYKLPGALKRKKSDLTIKIIGKEGSGKVVASYHRPGVHAADEFEQLTECNSDNDCAPMANVYAGDIIRLTTTGAGDRFSYWICDGVNCNEKQQGTTVASTEYQISVTGSNTIEAHFNKKDSHCIYNDFSNTVAYCNSKSSDDCIDYCGKGKYNCSVKDGSYPDANWIQVYANNKTIGGKLENYITPTIKGGKIYTDNEFLSSIDGSTVVLGRIESGYNGTMTALFEVPSVLSSGWDQILNEPINNGFIFRSNATASSYLALSVISKMNTKPLGYWTYARLCYVEGPETKNKDVAGKKLCVDVPFTGTLLGKEPVLVTKLTNASISITASDNMITANLSYNFGGAEFGSAYAAVDLDTTTFKNKIPDDGTHNYVGFKLEKPGFLKSLFNSQFKIYDLAWRTADQEYVKSCWDTPSVYCSFEANFTGGMVPDSVDVSPWVSTSSWFADKLGKCTFKYYYNGCDVPASYFSSERNILSLFADRNACKTGHGYYDKSAKELDLIKIGVMKSNVYNFTEEGDHGVPYNGGFESDASVMVTCSEDNGDGHRYDAHCGSFYVGEIVHCSESYPELLERSFTGSTSVPYTIPFKDGAVNARDADIRFTVSDLAEGASINVKLLDEGGDSSNVAYVITSNGTVSFNVNNDVSKSAGFNPQKVTALKFTSSGVSSSYTISNVQSVCQYAVSLTCNTPQYDPTTEKWKVSANVTQPGQAYGCKVTALGDAFALGGINIPEDPISCADFKMYLAQKGVYEYTANEGFYFRVEAVKQNGEVIDACETEKVKMPEVSVNCSVSADRVDRGAYVPSFSFEITGCPDDGCVYMITEPDGKKIKETGDAASGHCPNGDCKSINSIVNPLPVGDDNSYKVSVYGKSCEAKFEVTEPVTKANCTSASIDDGVFSALVDNDDWTGSLVINDHIGGASREISVTGGNTFTYPLTTLPAGSLVTLVLNGRQCSARVGSGLSLDCGTGGLIPVTDGVATFRPTVNGCSDGCSWSSTKGTATYSNGALSLSGITEGGEATITVSKDGTQKSCKVNLVVSQQDQSGCHCTCTSGCDNVVTTGLNLPQGHARPEPRILNACYFTTADNVNGDVPHIQSYGGGTVYVNGYRFTSQTARIYAGAADVVNQNGAYAEIPDIRNHAVDGGFYVQITDWKSGGWYAFAGGTPNCSGGSSTPTTPQPDPLTLSCPTFDSNQEQGTLLQFTPNVQGCDDGCEYTLYTGSSYVNNGTLYSGNAISFTGANSEGDKTYTLSVSRDGDTKSCDFTVTYNGNEEPSVEPPAVGDAVKITFEWGKSQRIEAGKNYVIESCKNSAWGSKRLKCKFPQTRGVKLYINGDYANESDPWYAKTHYADGGCYAGTTIRSENGDVTCVHED
ncbi:MULTISPECIES: hypothetical protein [unclassified Fibrobacter]|uniref:hypothetical protein n=1 Tax=unclassified Fibrobacter TaxID=2634177 RepID=UPI000D79D24D|nr:MULTISPECIES: hypothetical protein [unclassified Fibrobacter]PWJ59768.1 hypothetical protein BGX12_1399 [Fibrobacter sp. UWR4]PZW68034.1 hypothetical protein C8E88_102110 [Fibrobacter sp. UWR1]